MNSYRVQTPQGERWADLSFTRLNPSQWAARLMLDGKEFLLLGTLHGNNIDWTAVASKPARELLLPRSLTLVEGFRTRDDAARYLLKIHGVVTQP